MNGIVRSATALVVAVVVLGGSLAVGRALSEWRASRDTTAASQALSGSATAAATVAPTATTRPPVPAAVTRDEAVAFIRGLGRWNLRIDRIEAKLVPWSEFEPVGLGVDMTGGKAHSSDLPPAGVWAVAVGGDTYPEGAPVRLAHYTWSLWGVNALRTQLVSLNVGVGDVWPPGFDALADHVAVAPPTPTPSPAPVRFEFFNGPASHQKLPVRRMAAGDAAARDVWAIVENGSYSGGVPRTVLRHSADRGASWSDVATPADPSEVAASSGVLLVSVTRNAQDGRAAGVRPGLYLSRDAGATWALVVDDSIRLVRVFEYQGRRVLLAERMTPTGGAATGPSRILASVDGESWRTVGEVPGPATFALLDVPVVTYSKNIPGDGFYRVEGRDLSSLALVPVAGSRQTGVGQLLTGPSGELWHFDANSLVKAEWTTDGGRTWVTAGAGLAGRIAGLFVLQGRLYAVGDGAYVWDGAKWVTVSIVGEKAQAVFQLGATVFLQGYPGDLQRAG